MLTNKFIHSRYSRISPDPNIGVLGYNIQSRPTKWCYVRSFCGQTVYILLLLCLFIVQCTWYTKQYTYVQYNRLVQLYTYVFLSVPVQHCIIGVGCVYISVVQVLCGVQVVFVRKYCSSCGTSVHLYICTTHKLLDCERIRICRDDDIFLTHSFLL